MIVPFMNFHGQCEAAVLYYQAIFKFEDPFFLKFNQVQNLALRFLRITATRSCLQNS